MKSFSGDISRQPVHVIWNVSVGVMIQQRADSFERSLSGSQEQRRLVLVVLGVFVGSVRQQNVDSVDVVDGGGPVKRSLSLVISRIDVDIGVDQIFHHPFDGKTGSQNERRRSVVHPGIQIGRSIAQEDLEDALGV